MKKVKYLTPILGLTAMIGVAAPIATSCAKAVETTVLPYNLLKINGVTLTGIVSGTDLSKYDTIEIPEGIKIVSEDAFNHAKAEEPNAETEATFDYSTIKTLKLPSSIRTIDDKAFIGLTALSTIDLTDWNADTIQYFTAADNSFIDENSTNTKFCKVNLPEGLTTQQTEIAKYKLQKAGIPTWWYADQTTGHVTATEGVAKEITGTTDSSTTSVEDLEVKYQYAKGNTAINLTLTEPLDTEKYEINVYLQKTGATAWYDNVRAVSTPTILGKKAIEFTPIMYNADESIAKDEYPMLNSEGHSVNFDVNVVCTKKSTSEIVWCEKVDGFRLTNNYTHAQSVTIGDGQTKEFTGWLNPLPTDYLNYTVPEFTVLPTNAVDKTVKFVSDNESVAWAGEVAHSANQISDDTNVIVAQNPGEANITITSNDNPSATDTFKVTIPGIEIFTGSSDITNYIGSYYGHSMVKTGEKVGYTIPAKGVVSYRLQLNEFTNNDFLNGNFGENEAYRTFGAYQEVNTPVGGYAYEPIRPKAMHVTLIRDGETKTLEEGTDFGTYEASPDVCVLNGDNPAFVAQRWNKLTFKSGDTLIFKFEFDNEEAIENTGFMYQLWATK